eukprot:31135-Pelagococcus_subviridis.AAC.37
MSRVASCRRTDDDAGAGRERCSCGFVGHATTIRLRDGEARERRMWPPDANSDAVDAVARGSLVTANSVHVVEQRAVGEDAIAVPIGGVASRPHQRRRRRRSRKFERASGVRCSPRRMLTVGRRHRRPRGNVAAPAVERGELWTALTYETCGEDAHFAGRSITQRS